MIIEMFKETLKNEAITPMEIVRRYLIYGNPFVYEHDLEQYYALKERIAHQFNIHPHSVIMVGSAKLGFSIAPKKLWKPFDDESDIDIVIVSETAFIRYWSILLLSNDNISRENNDERDYRRFKDYFFRGWIRPDLLSYHYSDNKKEWFDFFKEASQEFGNGRKISGALYFGFDFFEKYHVNNIQNLRKMGETI